MGPVPAPASLGRWRRGAVAVLAGCAGVVGCRGGAGEVDRVGRVPLTSEPAPATTTTTTTIPTTASTAAPSSTTSTVPADPEIVLNPDGLGLVAFGDPAESVVARLSAVLGPPVDDRPVGSCATGEADRLVQFGELGVVLAGDGAAQRFVAWDVGLASGATPVLRTAEGVGVGSTLSELRAAYPDQLEVEPDAAFGPRFEVRQRSGAMTGTLTGTANGDTVVTLGAGAVNCSG